MSVLFISDLHLSEQYPHTISLFKQFLLRYAARSKALYILGDLFDSWIGDDEDHPLSNEIAFTLHALKNTGVPCYFMHGNRDFLLGADYAQRAGLSLLAPPAMITLYREDILLTHGDTLCTDDHAYQAFREKVRHPLWQQEFLAQPIETRREFARFARTESQRHTATSSNEIMDVNSTSVVRCFEQHGVLKIIHGHTHRPAIHKLKVKGKPATRIVLGDWGIQGNMLEIDEFGATLFSLSVDLQRIPLATSCAVKIA